MATVIRIIKYEGTEEALQKAIAQSLPLGQKLCSGYTITVAEHQNDLPPLLTVEEQRVADLFRGIAPVREMEVDQDQLGPFGDYLEQVRSSPIPAEVRPGDCSCPPKGFKSAWAAGPCPIHQGLRRRLHNANEASVRFTSCNCNIPGYEELPCPRHPGKL